MALRDETVALDTNIFVFALRRDTDHSACETLLFDRLHELNVYMPLQVLLELRRNLSDDEMRGVLLALQRVQSVRWDYALAPSERVTYWETRGAKKGDAVITAHLEAAGVSRLISENRHFLAEIVELSFEVLNSAQVVRLLNE